MFVVRFSETAIADFIGLHAWIEQAAGAEVADAYLGRIEARCRRLSDFPDRGSLRPELGHGVRSLSFERRRILLYRVLASEVTILRLVHGAADMSDIDER